MNRYSKVQSSIWQSKRFRKAKEYRLEYMYLLSCPHGNSAGFFELNEGYAKEDLMCSSQRLKKTLDELQNAGLIRCDGDLILIFQFLNINPYMNESHAKGSQKEIAGYEGSSLYPLFYEEVKNYCGEYLTDKKEGKPIFKKPEIQAITHGADTVPTQCPQSDPTKPIPIPIPIPIPDKEIIEPVGTLSLGEFQNVSMSKVEYEKLCAKYSKPMVDDKIAYLDAQIQSKIKKYMAYKDHYATIGNWCRGDKKSDTSPAANANLQDWERLPWEGSGLKPYPPEKAYYLPNPASRSKYMEFYEYHGIDVEQRRREK